jgi:hypothetical protein
MQKKTVDQLVDLIFVNRPKRTERIPKQRGRDREALRQRHSEYLSPCGGTVRFDSHARARQSARPTGSAWAKGSPQTLQ